MQLTSKAIRQETNRIPNNVYSYIVTLNHRNYAAFGLGTLISNMFFITAAHFTDRFLPNQLCEIYINLVTVCTEQTDYYIDEPVINSFVDDNQRERCIDYAVFRVSDSTLKVFLPKLSKFYFT